MQTDLTRTQGQEFIELYFGKYPGIRDYVDSMKEDARRKGYAETLSGRRRKLPDISSRTRFHRAAAERMAVNMPIQGTAADIAKIAMINIDKDMADRRLRSRMCIQVHDELIFEVAPGEMDEIDRPRHNPHARRHGPLDPSQRRGQVRRRVGPHGIDPFTQECAYPHPLRLSLL